MDPAHDRSIEIGDQTAATFTTAEADTLRGAGWIVTEIPGGLTLAGLRDDGVPFKGSRFFDVQARQTVEYTTVPTAIAYVPGPLPDSFNLSFESAEQRIADLSIALPSGVFPTVAPAAACVWLCQQHFETYGRYPFAQSFAWVVDRYQERTNLVVGIFGHQRPVLVAPLSEGRGAGVGAWPVAVPRSIAPALWPLAPKAPRS